MPYKDPEQKRKYQHLYWERNKETLKETGRERGRRWYVAAGKELRKDNAHREAKKTSDKKYNQLVRKQRKAERMNTLIQLFGGKCSACGLDEVIALDFHHVDSSTKKFRIADGKNLCWEALVCEARKCILLCCLCHRKKHGVASPSAKRRSDTLARQKLNERLVSHFGGECKICGRKDAAAVFDFHHVDPNQKSIRISQLLRKTRNWEKLLTEAQKCILVCCLCHRKIHAGRVLTGKGRAVLEECA